MGGAFLPLENIGGGTDILTKKGADVFTRLKICTNVYYLCTDVFYDRWYFFLGRYARRYVGKCFGLISDQYVADLGFSSLEIHDILLPNLRYFR